MYITFDTLEEMTTTAGILAKFPWDESTSHGLLQDTADVCVTEGTREPACQTEGWKIPLCTVAVMRW